MPPSTERTPSFHGRTEPLLVYRAGASAHLWAEVLWAMGAGLPIHMALLADVAVWGRLLWLADKHLPSERNLTLGKSMVPKYTEIDIPPQGAF